MIELWPPLALPDHWVAKRPAIVRPDADPLQYFPSFESIGECKSCSARAMLPGMVPPITRTGPDPRSLFGILSQLGLTSGVVLCLDAGDIKSIDAGSSQLWQDTSGNAASNVFRGTSAASEGSDPTFNGTPGGLSVSEYWSFDGADRFRLASGVNPVWVNAMHKDNAVWTCISWVRLTNFAANNSIFGTTDGVLIGTRMSLLNNANLILTVNRNNSDAHSIDTNSGLTAPGSAWCMLGVSVNEPTGAGGLIFIVNGTTAAASATYSLPTASDAGAVLDIGAQGNGSTAIRSGGRMAMVAMWSGTALSAAQMVSVFNATRGRFGV